MDIFNNVIRKITGYFQPKLISPVPEKDSLSNPAMQNYVAENEGRQRAASVTSNFQPQQIQYPQWMANAPNGNTPKASPTPTRAPQVQVKGMSTRKMDSYMPNISIPSSQGKSTTTLPPHIAQALLNAFDKDKEATNAARVLHHPKDQTYSKREIQKYGRESWNYGENASFREVADSRQSDGSIDRGLMRINSNTFNGLMKRHPDWMEKIGVSDWDQMNDPVKNAQVAQLVLLDSNYAGDGRMAKDPSYHRWFAAPRSLRKNE